MRACWRTRDSAREVALLRQVRVCGCFSRLAPTFQHSAEPRYSGDDAMLGCNEWLVGYDGVFASDRLETRQGPFDRVWLFAQLCLFVIVIREV